VALCKWAWHVADKTCGTMLKQALAAQESQGPNPSIVVCIVSEISCSYGQTDGPVDRLG